MRKVILPFCSLLMLANAATNTLATPVTVLHAFKSGADGAKPETGVILDKSGNLYGVTYAGGSSGNGTVFEITPMGSETILYSFAGAEDGSAPLGGLIRGSRGSLYGTLSTGGQTKCDYGAGCGLVFNLSSKDVKANVYLFPWKKNGREPSGDLLADKNGNLFGTTQLGGDSTCDNGAGCGIVFEIATDGTETVLHRFAGSGKGDGA